jgi:limonene-1,2-epoxide hydrolase
MSTENEDKANSFCNSLQDGDLAKGVLYLSENVDYQNVGMSVSKGRAGVREMLDEWVHGEKNMLKKMDIKHTASSGDFVMNERLETWVLNNVTVYLPVMGIFEFDSDGKICRWHDYMDSNVLVPLMAEMKTARGVESEFDDHLSHRESAGG